MQRDPINSTRCQWVKRNGQQCRAQALTDSKYCFFHDPHEAGARAAARRAGGIERSRRVVVLPADTPDRPLRNSGEVAQLLDDIINKTLRGELDPKIGYAVGYLANLRTKLFEQREMEERLAALEAIIKHRPDEPDPILADDPENGGAQG